MINDIISIQDMDRIKEYEIKNQDTEIIEYLIMMQFRREKRIIEIDKAWMSAIEMVYVIVRY